MVLQMRLAFQELNTKINIQPPTDHNRVEEEQQKEEEKYLRSN